MNWKLVGLAGLVGVAGVAASTIVHTRRRREWTDPTPDELRALLHERVAAHHD